jgi:hypothetical protein
MASERAQRSERKLYPSTPAGLEFIMGPALDDRIARFMGRSSQPGYEASVKSLVQVSSDITPGPYYDVAQHGKITRYSESLYRSQDYEFGLLADLRVIQKNHVANGLVMAVNLLNFYDRERLVHPPFFVEGERTPTLEVGIQIHPGDFKLGRRNLMKEFEALKTDFRSGPTIKGVKTAPAEFFVTSPSVLLPLPPDIE